MSPLNAEPVCEVRGFAEADGRVRLVSRNLVFHAEGQTSLHPRATHPSALDHLLGALAADLLAGFVREAAHAGVRLNDAELSLAARLDNPLVALGVIGEPGSAALSEVSGSLYAGSDADEPVLHALWQRALDRAPVHATLSRCAPVRIEFKLIP